MQARKLGRPKHGWLCVLRAVHRILKSPSFYSTYCMYRVHAEWRKKDEVRLIQRKKMSSLLGSVISTHVTQKLAKHEFYLGKPWVVSYSYILHNTLAVHILPCCCQWRLELSQTIESNTFCFYFFLQVIFLLMHAMTKLLDYTCYP